MSTDWTEVPPSSETVRDVPRAYWGKHLSTFRWDAVDRPEPRRDAVEDFMRAHREDGPRPHLLLLGRQGTGKTHLGVGLYRWAVYYSDLRSAAFVYVPEFLAEVKRSFGNDDVDPFERLERARLIVLDDLFGRDPTDWELSHVISRLIEIPHTNEASMVVTSNDSLDELRARIPPHESSRLIENAAVVTFRDRDRRGGVA